MALDLREAKITNAGLKTLARMTSLKTVALNGARGISRAGVDELQKALPGCRIESGGE